MASSQGELTLQFETRTLRQQSISMPSRLVSIFRLSSVRLSTPVARMANQPAASIEKSRRMTLRQFFRAIALFPTPGLSVLGVSVVVPSPLAPKRRTLKKGISLSDLAPLSATADETLKAPTAAADAAPVAATFRNSLLCVRSSLSLPMGFPAPGNFGYQSNSL